MIVPLVCPDCRKPVQQTANGVTCGDCEKTYPDKDGILSFLWTETKFNEGDYADYQKENWSKTARLRAKIRSSKILSLLNGLRIRFSLSGRRDRVLFRGFKGAKPGALILDVGCGGGRHYLARFGRVVGIDPVLPLLKQAQQIYNAVYQAGGFAMPFADESFDYVVSSDVIGHILEPDKDKLFGEMYRVLKKGGRTIHVIETDASNPWFRFAHRYPELFHKYFVETPGHYGLETPTALRQRFLKHGFREISFRKMSSRVQEVGGLASAFDNELREKSAWLSAAVAMDGILAKSLLLKEALNLLLEPVACLDDALSPIDYGSGMCAIYAK